MSSRDNRKAQREHAENPEFHNMSQRSRWGDLGRNIGAQVKGTDLRGIPVASAPSRTLHMSIHLCERSGCSV